MPQWFLDGVGVVLLAPTAIIPRKYRFEAASNHTVSQGQHG